MSVLNPLKALILPTLYAITLVFAGAEIFYYVQGYRLSLGYWFGVLFIYVALVVPAVLRRSLCENRTKKK